MPWGGGNNMFVFEKDKPVLCAMLQYNTPSLAIGAIRNGLANGAEAFGLQVESLEETERGDGGFGSTGK